jgi:putative glycosyltransferase (TIGR04348 family)
VHRESLVIVTPALADANNGNWQTAQRWARLLQSTYRVRLTDRWADGDEDLMVALHARRSAPSILAWRAAPVQRPLVLALTGTDLYRDIDVDPAARQSLAMADALVTLNALGARRLPPALRSKCHLVLQSCPTRQPLAKTTRHLRAVAVGHLRAEKDPRTFFRAVQRLADRQDIFFDHLGVALDPVLGQEAAALAATQSRYRWLGGLPHAVARRRIQAAHVLVHSSVMEGGAHVVIEAIRSGTPVLASRIDGNLGLLGDDYEGTFDVGDDLGLSTLIRQARDDPDMLLRLQQQVARRASLFSPESERTSLRRVLQAVLARQIQGIAT